MKSEDSAPDRPGPAAPPVLKEMFNHVSARYDLLNRLLSLGRDVFWRRALARRLVARDYPGSFLDLATGSGDQLLASREFWPHAELTGLDFSETMLDIAGKKLKKRGLEGEADLILGDVREPPFESELFDSVSISFGLRNIAERDSLYREAFRVLKPGGRFLVLELFFDPRSLVAPLHRLHLEIVTPWLARRLFKSQKKAYAYLSRSIMAFPHPAVIADELKAAGFKGVEYRTYTFGSAMLVWGQKPLPE